MSVSTSSPSGSPSQQFTIPQPHIASLNTNSLSAYGTSKSAASRRRTIISILKQLLKRHGILCLQETHLGRHEQSYLSHSFPKHAIYYNNHHLGHAGTIILVNKSILTHHSVSQLDLGPGARGFIQAIRLLPRSSLHRPYTVINTYLQSGLTSESSSTRASQLSSLLRLATTDYTFMVGTSTLLNPLPTLPPPTPS